jgi:hypothetical protein
MPTTIAAMGIARGYIVPISLFIAGQVTARGLIRHEDGIKSF